MTHVNRLVVVHRGRGVRPRTAVRRTRYCEAGRLVAGRALYAAENDPVEQAGHFEHDRSVPRRILWGERMKASETTFAGFVQGQVQFQVPLYQRTYSWDEPQLQQLWDRYS